VQGRCHEQLELVQAHLAIHWPLSSEARCDLSP
jgi:hypothetical protein